MAVATTGNKKIVEMLNSVKGLYHRALEMDRDEKERFILEYIRLLGGKHEDVRVLTEACNTVLTKWSGHIPHDSSLMDEALKLIPYPYKQAMPASYFDQDMLIYKWIDKLIEDLFHGIDETQLERVDQHIVQTLWRSVHNTLVENPNFKGENPYYKRNFSEYERSRKLWLEILDEKYENYTSYFMEE